MYQSLPKVLLFLLVPIYAICLFAPAFGQMHDDGIYLASARALANGSGYVVDSLPNAIPQTKYPVLYPAIIAIFWKFTSDIKTVAFLCKLVSIASTVAWIFALKRLLKRRLPNEETVNWVIFVGVSVPWAVYLSTSVLPDTLFAFLTTLALAQLMDLEEGAPMAASWKTAILVGALGSAAFLIRTTGLALLLAAFIMLFLRRRSLGMTFLLVVLFLCGPWLMWQASHPAPIDAVQLYYSKLSYAKGHLLAGFSVGQMFTVLLFNVVMLSTFFNVATLYLPGLLALGIGGFVAYHSCAAWFRDIRERVGILNLWALLYMGILMVWIWPPHRYLVPLLPIVLMYAAQGFGRVNFTRLRLKWLRMGLVAYGGLVVLANGASAFHAVKYQNPTVGWTQGDDWPSQTELAEWVRRETPKEAIIAANLDPAVYLLTGRKAIRLFPHLPFELFYGAVDGPSPVGSAEDMRRHLKDNKVTHVLLSPMKNYKEGEFFWKVFTDLQRRSPKAFQLRKRVPREGYAVYEVNHVNL